MSTPETPITPERWQAVRRLFEEALELPSEERAALLERVRGDDADLARRVDQMLGALDEESTLLESPAFQLASPDGASPPGVSAGSGSRSEEAIPDSIGPYRLVELLGRGGMGEVFLAHRDDDEYHKEVAIKLLRRGAESRDLLGRFRRERQILASLEHPNIAKLLDGGTTPDGKPYLVMEYVRGQPIDRYCREAGLDIDARITLFLDICDAIRFAHRNLVVHRDLKPGNILVTEAGEPKLLDFGIAKILGPEEFPQTVLPTRTGLMPMTPAYASPEQIRGQPVTTATDVYALGVLLYEILAGRRPYEVGHGNLDTLVDAICHREPSKPSAAVRERARSEPGASTGGAGDESPRAPRQIRQEARRLERRLAGDLDAIVLRALAKDPAERYASASELRDDLEQHLEGRPVRARSGTWLYHGGKFVRRHRWAVAGVTFALGALLAFLLVLLDQQQRLIEENERTLLQKRRAEKVSEWMIELFELPAPSRSLGEKITARELLDKGARDITGSLEDQPVLRAELMGTMGHTYSQIGLYREGIDLLRQSVELYEEDLDSAAPEELAERSSQLAHALTVLGEYSEAVPIAERALALYRSRGELESETGEVPDRSDEADSLARLGNLQTLIGNYSEARATLARALELARVGARAEVLAKALEYSADIRIRLGETEAASELYEESLELLIDTHGERHPETLLMRASLAQASKLRDSEAAEALLRQAIEDQSRLFDGAHGVLATALNNLGLLLHERFRYEEALELLGRALDMEIELYGEDHPEVAIGRVNLANTQAALGEDEAAELMLRDACSTLERRLGPNHIETGSCLNNLASLLQKQGRIDETLPLLRRAERILQSTLGSEHIRLVAVLNGLGQIERLEQNRDEAERAFRQALRIARASDAPLPEMPFVLFNLGVVLGETDREAEAIECFDEFLEIMSPIEPPPIQILQAETRIAKLRLDLEQFEAAEKAARRAFRSWQRTKGDLDPWTLSAQSTLGRALSGLGRFDEAEGLLLDRLAKLEQIHPPGSRRLRSAREHLIELYLAADRSDEAARHRTLLEALPQP